MRKLIEAAHTEAWEILTEYRDVLDILAGELLEKETLHRAELQAIFGDVKKRPRLTMFDDFGGRMPSDKPPIKTPGELAIERGEPWPKPVPEPAFKTAIAQASKAAAEAAQQERRPTATDAQWRSGARGDAAGLRCTRRLACARLASATRRAAQPQPQQPQQQPQGYWYPPPPPSGWQGSPPPGYYPPYPPHPQSGSQAPHGGASAPGHKEDPGHESGKG